MTGFICLLLTFSSHLTLYTVPRYLALPHDYADIYTLPPFCGLQMQVVVTGSTWGSITKHSRSVQTAASILLTSPRSAATRPWFATTCGSRIAATALMPSSPSPWCTTSPRSSGGSKPSVSWRGSAGPAGSSWFMSGPSSKNTDRWTAAEFVPQNLFYFTCFFPLFSYIYVNLCLHLHHLHAFPPPFSNFFFLLINLTWFLSSSP